MCALFVAAPGSNAAAQAVYGSIGGVVKDASGAAMPGATVTVTSVDRKTVDTVVTNESGFYVKDRLLPGLYEVKAELTGFKTAVLPEVRVSVDTQTPINFDLQVGAVTEQIEVTGGSPLLKTDRADVSTNFDSKQITDLPVLDRNFTEVHPPDAGHAAARVAARGERKPAGVHPDDGQRAALQRHRLPARWNRQPRSHPGHHRHQSHARVDSGNEDHLAELRRRVRSGDGRRRLGADQVRQEPVVRQRLRVPPGRQVPVAESVYAVPGESADRQAPAKDGEESVRRLDWRQDRREPGVLLRRLPGHAQHRRRLEAADASRHSPRGAAT